VEGYLIYNDDNIHIDSLKDYNHLQISEQIINRRKLNNNLKRKALNELNVIYVCIKYTRVAIYIKNRNGTQFTATTPSIPQSSSLMIGKYLVYYYNYMSIY